MSPHQGLSFLSAENFRLPYRVYGSGPELLIAFHGFGRSGQDFESLSKVVDARYTCIAFDFFYHGPSAMSVEEELPPFSSAHLASMVEKLLWEHKKVKVTLVGCSLGGKLVLGLMQRIPHRIEAAYLLAPDGFTRDRVRHFATNSPIGRFLAQAAVKDPGYVLKLISFSRTVGIIDLKLHDFLCKQLENKENRQRIWRIWNLLPGYSLNLGLIAHYVRSKGFPVVIVNGSQDTITPVNSQLKKFVSKLGKQGKLVLVDGGHSILSHSDEIGALILSRKNSRAEKPIYA